MVEADFPAAGLAAVAAERFELRQTLVSSGIANYMLRNQIALLLLIVSVVLAHGQSTLGDHAVCRRLSCADIGLIHPQT